MSRISALATARAALAAVQPALIAAQLALPIAQSAVTAAEAAVTAAELLPLDTWISDADGLADFIGEDGNVLPATTIYILGYTAQTGIFGGQSMLGPISSAAFANGVQGPGAMVRDASNRLQFQTGGSEIPPLPLSLEIVRANTGGGDIDAAPTVTTINLT